MCNVITGIARGGLRGLGPPSTEKKVITRFVYPYNVPGTSNLVNMTLNMHYKNDKNIKVVVTRFVFKLKMHENPFSAGALLRTLLGELMTLPQTRSRQGRGYPLPIPPSTPSSTRRLGSQALSTQNPGYTSERYTSNIIFFWCFTRNWYSNIKPEELAYRNLLFTL